RVWKYGIRRSGISTQVSPSGTFRAASAAGSVTAQPCTIQDLRSVRYKAGEPSGTESGSFATKVSSMFHLSFRTLPELALASSSPPSSRLSICKFLQVPGVRCAGYLDLRPAGWRRRRMQVTQIDPAHSGVPFADLALMSASAACTQPPVLELAGILPVTR